MASYQALEATDAQEKRFGRSMCTGMSAPRATFPHAICKFWTSDALRSGVFPLADTVSTLGKRRHFKQLCLSLCAIIVT